MLSFASLLAPIRILLCEIAILNRSLHSKAKQGIKPKGRDIKREKMIARSNLAELLREYQIRSKHDWASVSFFASTSNPTSSRVDVSFVIWELVILAFLVCSSVSLYFRHMHLAFILAGIAMLLFLCIKITKQVRLANNKKRRMMLPLSM
ncbi:uncharacterized protein LOC120157542 [Hibiscus syriacus]|uniref:uncharacterized protein LOC120157542 n=1 Tax=Hibiscus syriacus TaxID=106335 RepID=UPI001922CDD4|nr:uncharacterized protein LOC120157542 [Hibiscus syriacus]